MCVGSLVVIMRDYISIEHHTIELGAEATLAALVVRIRTHEYGLSIVLSRM